MKEERKEERSEQTNVNSYEKESNVNPNQTASNNDVECQKYDSSPKLQFDYEAVGDNKFEVLPHQITIIKIIGKGYYSNVLMGTLSLPTGNIPVAVKKPHTTTGSINAKESEDILELQRQALRNELNIFAHLQSSPTGGHENILKLVGAVTTIRADFCLLTEYCEWGSLDCFLQKKWKNGKYEDELIPEADENENVWKIQRDSSWGENYRSRRESGLITTSDLLWFALQIARAMQFLTEMNIIHRDAALRNVLLKSDFTLKVADFGLSKKLQEIDGACYVWEKRTALPIRYIAPESLKSGRFTIASEFWSFGVVVWELFTFAEKQPYSAEFENNKGIVQFYEFLIEYLSSCRRLLIPDNVPKQLSRLLSRLWHSDSKQRPSFQVCRSFIRKELMQSCPNMLLKEKGSHDELECSLSRFKDEDPKEGTSEILDPITSDSSIPALPLTEPLSMEEPKIRPRKKFKRRIIVSVGVLIVIVVAIAITLGVTFNFNALSSGKENSTNGTDIILTGPLNNIINKGYLYSTDSIDIVTKSAEQGDANSQYNLGLMYLTGRGVPQSDEEAVKWFSKAAQQGNVNAQNYLEKISG